jgi:hypothetical protein
VEAMSSSLKPCPEGRKVHLVEVNGVCTLYICLVEDKNVKKEELKNDIKQAGISQDVIGLDADRIVSRLSTFLKDLGEVIRRSIREVYGEKGPVDISLPREINGAINPGEFVGNFSIYDTGKSRVVLHVEPKVGWTGYLKMLEETKQSIDLLASRTGVLEPLLGNLYYPLLSSPISYSILLLRLTELILSSIPPKKTISVEVLSEGVVGRPVVYKTVKYLMQGYPLGVYERIRIELHDYPYILLAKFHYELSNRLSEILDVLYEVASEEKYYELLTGRINILRSLHVYHLTSPPLQGLFNILLREGLTDQELLEETRRTSKVNPYFGLLADLYEMYLSNIGLIHEYVERGAIVPSASCKIYELWVLTRIVDIIKEKHGILPKISKYKDLYLVLKSRTLRLIYNLPRYGFFAGELKRSKLLYKPYKIRPDFILEAKRGSIKEAIVYDAKYKIRLTMSDVIKLLAYIAEFAMPIWENNNKVLLGVFYKLKKSNTSIEEHYSPIVKNNVLPMKVVINVFVLDPRMPGSKVKSVVEQSLQPLLKGAVIG